MSNFAGDYLSPHSVFDYGVSHADEPRDLMIKSLQLLFGYKHAASVRKLTRNPDKNQRGTGERNPILLHELVFRFFWFRNRAAAILMRERFLYFYEVLMNETSSQATQDFNAGNAALELKEKFHAFEISAVKGETDLDVMAAQLAEIEATAQLQLQAIRSMKVKAKQPKSKYDAEAAARLQLASKR